MSVTINGIVPVEVANPAAALVAGSLEGALLYTNTDGLADLATDPMFIDGIQMTEVVNAADFKDRTYIFKDIDYSGYTAVGDYIVVARQIHGCTVYGVQIEAPATLVTPGTTLIMGTVPGKLKVRPGGDVASKTLAVAMDKIAAGALITGKIHFRHL